MDKKFQFKGLIELKNSFNKIKKIRVKLKKTIKNLIERSNWNKKRNFNKSANEKNRNFKK